MNWRWPENSGGDYAPWWEIGRRCAMFVPFYVLGGLLVVVVLLGWGVKDAARFWRDLT